MAEDIDNHISELSARLRLLLKEGERLDSGDVMTLGLSFKTWTGNVAKTLEAYQAFADISCFRNAGWRRPSVRQQTKIMLEQPRPPSEGALRREIRAKRETLRLIIDNVEQHPELYADPHENCKQKIQQLESDKTQLKSKIRERDQKLDQLENQAFKRSIYVRLTLAFTLTVVIEAVPLYFALRYGQGQNWLQKLETSWLLLTSVFLGVLALSSWILGKKRIRSLGWPLTKILKTD